MCSCSRWLYICGFRKVHLRLPQSSTVSYGRKSYRRAVAIGSALVVLLQRWWPCSSRTLVAPAFRGSFSTYCSFDLRPSFLHSADTIVFRSRTVRVGRQLREQQEQRGKSMCQRTHERMTKRPTEVTICRPTDVHTSIYRLPGERTGR